LGLRYALGRRSPLQKRCEWVSLEGNRILTKVGRFLPGAEAVPLERLTLEFRPVPLDEFPIMGALQGSPDIHAAVTHSGVTLGPPSLAG
jgi:glycine/D-amino acid oxidase-like deaminating enzyme